MNGNKVFEMLSKMTQEERSHCVFPGFWDDEESDIIISEMANNCCFDDDEYDKALAIDKGVVAEFWKKAIDKEHEEWGEYVQLVKDDVCAMIENAVKN